jgi:hypothetical protein
MPKVIKGEKIYIVGEVFDRDGLRLRINQGAFAGQEGLVMRQSYAFVTLDLPVGIVVLPSHFIDGTLLQDHSRW